MQTQGINTLTMSEETFGNLIDNTKQINKTLYNIQQKTQNTIDNCTEMKWDKKLNLKENTDWKKYIRFHLSQRLIHIYASSIQVFI